MYKKKWITGFLLVLALALLFCVSFIVLSEVNFFSVSQQNLSFCNVQGQIFGVDNNAMPSNTQVNCTLIRANGINTTYSTFSKEGFPNTASYNNYYRCTMLCGNLQQDNVSVFAFNTTENGTSTSAFSSSTLYLNVTFSDLMAPVITGITGNASGTTGDALTIEVNATDNGAITGGNITLSNTTVFQLTQISSTIYRATFSLHPNSTTTINYTASIFDLGNNNATSAVYYINITDNDAPSANASDDQSADQYTNVQFNASNSADNIGITAYYWNFRDGSAINNAVAPLKNYTQYGNFNVSLTVSDAAGNNGTDYVLITVRDAGEPYVIANSPVNTSQNISLDTSINITFNEYIKPATLSSTTIDIRDNENNKVYGNVTFNGATNTTTFTTYILLDENKFYIVNVTRNVQDNSSNNLTTNYKFNFTTKQRDTDNDGIPDNEETDDDGDGVADTNDKVKGNLTNIKVSNIQNLSLTFNTTVTDLIIVSNSVAVYDVNIKNGTHTIINFTIDLSTTTIDLTNVSIYQSDNDTVGELLVYGLNMSQNQKKKIYLVNKTYAGICVKDMHITSLTDISQSCTGDYEYKVYCDGTANSSYTCTYDASTQRLEVSGLAYSGVREIDYKKVAPSDGGGGAGGGGGGLPSCTESWACNEWSVCGILSKQTRICTDKNKCGTIKLKPLTSKSCIYMPPIPVSKEKEEAGAEEIKEAEEEEKAEEIADEENGEIPLEEKQIAVKEEIAAKKKTIVGKVYSLLKENKANIYFILFVGLIILSLLIFNLLKKKDES